MYGATWKSFGIRSNFAKSIRNLHAAITTQFGPNYKLVLVLVSTTLPVRLGTIGILWCSRGGSCSDLSSDEPAILSLGSFEMAAVFCFFFVDLCNDRSKACIFNFCQRLRRRFVQPSRLR